MEDSQIIELFLARNEDAIRHTDDTYGRRLYHLADGILRSGPDAEESVSDTYLQAWNTIPPQRPTHFYAYIAKICRNFALKKLDWKNAQKRKAEIVALTQEMESCIPDTARVRFRNPGGSFLQNIILQICYHFGKNWKKKPKKQRGKARKEKRRNKRVTNM